MTARPVYTLSTTPPSRAHTASAAIAIIDVRGPLDSICSSLNCPLPPVGAVRLLSIPGIDELLIVRVAEDHLQFQPHAGPVVLDRLAQRLTLAGAIHSGEAPPADRESLLEAWLAAAESPLAIDPLLQQLRLLRENAPDRADPCLNHLLIPPLVAAVGRPNIGKSSLLNALARRSVSVVCDQPGTTRDSVGVMLDLAGLVVRWIDLPGLRETSDPIEQQAIRRAGLWLEQADLVIHCIDAADPSPDPPPIDRPTLTVRTRADLASAEIPSVLSCSAHSGRGLPELALAIREHLVPAKARHRLAIWDLPPLPSP